MRSDEFRLVHTSSDDSEQFGRMSIISLLQLTFLLAFKPLPFVLPVPTSSD